MSRGIHSDTYTEVKFLLSNYKSIGYIWNESASSACKGEAGSDGDSKDGSGVMRVGEVAEPQGEGDEGAIRLGYVLQ